MDTVYLVAPLLLLGVVLTAVWLDRFSVPVILVALGLGIVFGSDVVGVWYFDDVHVANDLANAGLVFILFQGGLSTKREDFRAVALPAGGLATWGVILTAAATYGCLHGVLGWPTDRSLLLAVIISSTDAAATFSILRRHSLPQRLSSTLEIESAANDPMAILLTLAVVEGIASSSSGSWLVVPLFLWKFLAGPVVGWVMAQMAAAIFNRLNPQERGYYYVLLIAVVPLTYGLAEKIQVSGMLAVFTAGLFMGNQHVIYKQGIRNFSGALSTIANIGMFMMMGLLVFPHQWSQLWLDGIVLFVVLTFVARPAAVWLGTAGMGFTSGERLFMSWAGLRGAVPIILATYPMAAGIAAGQDVFNLVFFAVLLSVSMQGSTLGWLARRLNLSQPSRPSPRYGLELVTMAHSDMDLVVVDLPGPQGRPGPRLRDLVLPRRALITLVTRGSDIVAPTGNTRLLGWDQVTILAGIEDEGEIRRALLEPFERPFELEGPASRVLDPETVQRSEADADRMRGHTVLIGHGRVGAVMASFLTQRELPFVVIEQDKTIAEELRRSRVRVVRGEAARPDVLRQANIAEARLLLMTAADPMSARRAIEYAQAVNPSIEIVARVHNDAQRQMLGALPRTHCVQGEVELAHGMARIMLQALGVSAIEAEASIIDARRGQGRPDAPRTRVTEIHVPPTSPVLGKTLAELTLPSGALIIAIARAGEFVVPGGQTQVRADDALLVLADLEMARAIERIVLEPHPEAS
jgi:cell volume regulation protein A